MTKTDFRDFAVKFALTEKMYESRLCCSNFQRLYCSEKFLYASLKLDEIHVYIYITFGNRHTWNLYLLDNYQSAKCQKI